MCDSVTVKSNVQWRPQVIRDARKVEYLLGDASRGRLRETCVL